MSIGFIGLGVTGAPMARHLDDAGHHLATTLRKSPLPSDIRATVVAKPADVAKASEIVIAMLPDTPDVERVLLGPDGVVEGLQTGVLESARALGIALPNTAAAQQLMSACRARTGGLEADHSFLVHALATLSNHELTGERI